MQNLKVIAAGIILLLVCKISAAQEESVSMPYKIKRSSIFGAAGTCLFWGEANINCELIILQSKKKPRIFAFGVQAGYGAYVTVFDGEGNTFNSKLFFLVGSGPKFFEFTAGANLFVDIDDYYWKSVYVPAVSFGFRDHGKNGKALVRIGLGWPVGFYFGAGVRF